MKNISLSFRVLCFLALGAFTLEPAYSQYRALAERNRELRSFSPEREALYDQISQYHAPLLYIDFDRLTDEGLEGATDLQGNEVKEVFSPGDAIVSPFFAGTTDLENNGAEIFRTVEENGILRLAHELRAQVPSSILETESHFYLSYILYRAWDGKKNSGHTHDSEVAWFVLKKTENPERNELEFVVLNAHGYGKIYAPDLKRQRALRAQMRKHLASRTEQHRAEAADKGFVKAQLARIQNPLTETGNLIYFLDRFAIFHHDRGPSPFVGDEAQTMRIFSCREGHALFMCNPEAWERGYGSGYIAVCVEKGMEGEFQCYPAPPAEERIIGYSTFNFDRLILELYSPSELKRSRLSDWRDERGGIELDGQKIFDPQQSFREIKVEYETSEGVIRFRPELPRAFIRGPGESRPAANLHVDWGMKTPYRLGVPHLLHSFLEPDRTDISDVYLFNPYVEFVRLNDLR